MADKIDLDIDLQLASAEDNLPTEDQVNQWVTTSLQAVHYKTPPDLTTELTLRIVNQEESRSLNKSYRNKDYATNVLSFPFEGPEGIPLALLGDLVICAPVVKQESQEQHKPLQHHWAHMVVHGTLHLLGYDHMEAAEADEMEALEVQILKQLDIADPYQNYHET
ncbi:rRNA maturation RNase YbeY [Ketobacter sp.]